MTMRLSASFFIACLFVSLVVSSSWDAKAQQESNPKREGPKREGAITGRVTDDAGEPIVGVNVSSYRLRDLEGKTTGAVYESYFNRGGMTDDRGIYRIYGLPPVRQASIGAGFERKQVVALMAWFT
jgi:protocatechuate 3,4-dioxygenase beta subunit